MILATAVGWSLQHFAGFERAILPAVLVGMMVAAFVPARSACPVRTVSSPIRNVPPRD